MKITSMNMGKSKKQNPIDKKKLLREADHLTVPPRLEGKVKNAKMNPIKKKSKSKYD
jgi:hypothetical protein